LTEIKYLSASALEGKKTKMMKTEALTSKSLLIGGSTLAAGILASSSAHAQLLIQNPDYTISGDSDVYFNVDTQPPGFSSTDTTQELELTSNGSGSGKIYPTPDSAVALTDGTVSAGSTVDSSSSFKTDGDGDFPANGFNQYGFEDEVSGQEHYGYINITQSEDSSGPEPVFTDTLNTIVYDEMANLGVEVEAIPEPSTTSLLAAAAMGAAGLALYRRSRKRSA
jgi:PEP-CTERM motif